MLRSATLEDAHALAEIYNYYIRTSVATLEETAVNTGEMKERILRIIRSKLPWIVYEEEGQILGYAYASEWKARSGYKHSVESTVYLNHENTKKGVGSMLYKELLQKLREMNFHAIIGGISLPNEASVALHEKFGFEKVAHFKEVGYKFKKWVDVGYWELKTIK